MVVHVILAQSNIQPAVRQKIVELNKQVLGLDIGLEGIRCDRRTRRELKTSCMQRFDRFRQRGRGQLIRRIRPESFHQAHDLGHKRDAGCQGASGHELPVLDTEAAALYIHRRRKSADTLTRFRAPVHIGVLIKKIDPSRKRDGLIPQVFPLFFMHAVTAHHEMYPERVQFREPDVAERAGNLMGS